MLKPWLPTMDIAHFGLRDHLRLPLYRNAYALLLSGIISSGLGMLYWILAARTYDATIVGLNSAAIAALMLLSGMAQMSMNSALIRYLAIAGQRSRTLILGCYAVAIGVAVVAGVGYGRQVAYWTPALAPYLATWPAILLFTLAIISWTIYVLQDSVLAGLRQAVWVPVENSIGAVLKIILLLALPTLLPVYGIFAAWLIPVLLSVPPVTYFIFRQLLPAHVRATAATAAPLAWAPVSRYVLGNYVGTLCYLGYTTLLPILVTAQAGASANAYFYMPWMLAAALQLIGLNLTTSLTVEGAHDGQQLALYCYRVLRQGLYLVTPLVLALWIGAPTLLQLFGADYAREGTLLLRLLALSTLPNLLVLLYLSVSRVQHNTQGVILAQGLLCVTLLGLSYLLLPRLGIAGVGWAALVGQLATALFTLFTPLRSLLRQGYQGR